MPAENGKDNQSNDVVAREDYNKVVESRNSTKAEVEKLQKEIEQLKSSQKTVEEKSAWEKETVEIKKQMEEIKKIAEDKRDNTKVAKGIVPQSVQQEQTKDVKAMLEKLIPAPKVEPNKYGSNIHRFGHYKSPVTRQYTDEQLGMGLSLHAGALRTDPNLVPSGARRDADDLVVRRRY